MNPKNNSFSLKDLLNVLIINLKVFIAIIFFLAVFFALFFGYYSIILIAFSLLFLVYSLIDTLRKNEEEEDSIQEEMDDQ